jgi:hypothetical protein
MQARVELMRFPAIFFVIVFALASALCLGAVLGYTLKPGSTQVIVVHDPSTVISTAPGCIWVDSKKGC